MSFSKNGTINSGSTSTAGYNYPSSSLTHQKQPNMPNDQKAKLLAMHRDGNANAGMYVAVVLVVYFILVTILLCRYGKRRRTSEPSSGLDSSAEQGRLHLLCFPIRKMSFCCASEDEEGRYGNLSNRCFGRCQRVNTPSSKSMVHQSSTTQKEIDEDKMGKSTRAESSSMNIQSTNVGNTKLASSGLDKCDQMNKRQAHECTQQDYEQNEDSEESLEDD